MPRKAQPQYRDREGSGLGKVRLDPINAQEQDVAVLFGLAVQPSEVAPDALCAALKQRYRPVVVSGETIEVHDPSLTHDPGFKDRRCAIPVISVLPKGASIALPIDSGFRLELSDDQRHEILRQLYDLIRGLPGYETALAGWDTDWDLCELAMGDNDLIMDGRASGLVVTPALKAKLPIQAGFEPFDESHDWIPYQPAAGRGSSPDAVR